MKPKVVSMLRMLLICVVASRYFVYCVNRDGTQTISTNGFLVIMDSSDWLFFPAKNVDLESCHKDFTTDNLKLGIRVYPEQLADTSYSILDRSTDTIILRESIEVENGRRSFMKVTPVSLTYSIENQFVGSVSQLRSNFAVNTKTNKLSLEYDQFPLKIVSMNPIFCLNRKRNDIREPECSNFKEDPDGYLQKICEYLTSKDKYSIFASRYKIISVKMDTLNKQEVVAVELSCCYLGDVAYFHPTSKKLLSMRFGAK